MTTLAVDNLREPLNRYDVEPDTYTLDELVARDLLTVEVFTPEYRCWLHRFEVTR